MNKANMNMRSVTMVVSFLATAPLFAIAQTTIISILGTVSIIINWVIVLLMTAAFAVFLWGIVKYISAAGDEKKMAEAKGYLRAGVIGLFVMVAIWGILKVLVNTFELDTRAPSGFGDVPSGTNPGRTFPNIRNI